MTDQQQQPEQTDGDEACNWTAEQLEQFTRVKYANVSYYNEVAAQNRAMASKFDVDKAEAELRQAQTILRRVQNGARPCMTLGAQIKPDGDAYVAVYGELSVRGDTPEIAFQNFDRLWMGTDE